MRLRSGSSQGVAASETTRRPARSTMTLRHRAEGLGWRGLHIGNCSVSAGSDSLTAISAGMLQPTELSGYQSASPDSSGQEQGGVSARLRPAASCAGQRQPISGLTGEINPDGPLPSCGSYNTMMRICQERTANRGVGACGSARASRPRAAGLQSDSGSYQIVMTTHGYGPYLSTAGPTTVSVLAICAEPASFSNQSLICSATAAGVPPAKILTLII